MDRSKHTTKRLAGFIALALALALATSPMAIAQDSAAGTYDGDGGPTFEVANVGGSGSAGGGDGASADAAGDGALPFTGMDIGMAIGGALLLLGTGLALSRVVVREPQA